MRRFSLILLSQALACTEITVIDPAPADAVLPCDPAWPGAWVALHEAGTTALVDDTCLIDITGAGPERYTLHPKFGPSGVVFFDPREALGDEEFPGVPTTAVVPVWWSRDGETMSLTCCSEHTRVSNLIINRVIPGSVSFKSAKESYNDMLVNIVQPADLAVVKPTSNTFVGLFLRIGDNAADLEKYLKKNKPK